MTAAPVLVRHEGRVAYLTLNRPAAANTINLELAAAFGAAVAQIRASDARVLVIDANGPLFCGGGDVAEMHASDDLSDYIARLAGSFHEALADLTSAEVLTIAAVQGAAAGGGFGLALNCDLIVASEKARFLTAYEAVGLTPDSGVSALLPRTIGLHRALALSLTGRVVDAATALEWGIVSQVVAPDDLAGTVDALAQRLASSDVTGLIATMRQFRAGQTAAYPAHLDTEAAFMSETARTPHAIERVRAFATRSTEKRTTG